jgi:cob(I)alamin adenosyltransferase
MSIVTKTGDQGETGRFGGGRIKKTNPRISAIGDVDELNSAIGLLSARTDLPLEINEDIKTIQATCFTIGSNLSTPTDAPQEAQEYIPRLKEEDLSFLEKKVDELEHQLSSQNAFILPGGRAAASMSFWIRAICRRAERSTVASHELEEVPALMLQYLNRLSDYFYVLARFLNQEAGVEETQWKGGHKFD